MHTVAVKKPPKQAFSQKETSKNTTKTANSGLETGPIAQFFILRENGARYLDPKTSRWISADPAMGEYVPMAPVNDDAKKHNGSLPGMGGIFNLVNMHAYHYAGNNPITLTDPDGRKIVLYGTDEEKIRMRNLINEYSHKQYDFDSNGILYDTGKFNDRARSSRSYSRALDSAIKPEDKTIVLMITETAITPDEKRYNLDSRGGGMTFYAVDGNNNVIRDTICSAFTGRRGYSELGYMPPADVVMHELIAHSIPLMLGGRDNDNAIDIDNIARQELGLVLRNSDPSHTVREQ